MYACMYVCSSWTRTAKHCLLTVGFNNLNRVYAVIMCLPRYLADCIDTLIIASLIVKIEESLI